jgi:hypothetical protein
MATKKQPRRGRPKKYTSDEERYEARKEQQRLCAKSIRDKNRANSGFARLGEIVDPHIRLITFIRENYGLDDDPLNDLIDYFNNLSQGLLNRRQYYVQNRPPSGTEGGNLVAAR